MADNKEAPAAPADAQAPAADTAEAQSFGSFGSFGTIGICASLAAVPSMQACGTMASMAASAGSFGGAASTQLGAMPSSTGFCLPPPCFAAPPHPAAAAGLQAPLPPCLGVAPASTVGSTMVAPACVNFCCSSCGTAPGCGCNAAVAPAQLGAQAPTSSPLALGAFCFACVVTIGCATLR